MTKSRYRTPSIRVSTWPPSLIFQPTPEGQPKANGTPPSLIFKSAQGGQPKPTFSTVQTQRLPISASTQSTQTVCVPGSVCVCEKFVYVYVYTQTKNFVYYTN